MGKIVKFDTSDIYEDLRVKLVTGFFEQGQKLRPGDLRDAYGCSANTLREALLRLSAVGLVSFEEQRGFRACEGSDLRRSDLTQFRILLEQEGTTRSMAQGGIEWEAQVTAAHYKLSHIENEISKTGQTAPLLGPWSAAEWEFHYTLISACGSDVLRETFRMVYDQFRQQLITKARNYGYFPGNVAEHKQIVEAVQARDAALCRQRIYDHLARNLVPSNLTPVLA